MAYSVPPLVQRKLEELPRAPGCYLMYGPAGEVLYVGKAKVLRSRVRSYFTPSQRNDPRVERLVPEIADVSWWITTNELQALTLENNLIKEHQPPFNVLLKDDKTFPYLKINWQDPFPKIEVTRTMRRDGARYFGPYTNARAIHRTLEGIRRIFPYLDCDRRITGADERPCLYYHLKMCGGPCIGAQSSEQYRESLRQMMRFLRGDTGHVMRQLRARMEQAAENLDFERAALIRDRIKAAERIVGQQVLIGAQPDNEDCVTIVPDSGSGTAVVQIMFVRQGRLVGRDHYRLELGKSQDPGAAEERRGDLIGSFLQQFYARAAYVPALILVQAMPPEQAWLEQWLAERRGTKVRLSVPLRGPKRRLMESGLENNLEYLRIQQATARVDTNRQQTALAELEEALQLPRPPVRMECYDISTLQGNHTAGSMVVFARGVPRKSDYRRFRIRGAGARGAPDDFASMREMLDRRFARAGEKGLDPGRKGKTAWNVLPDLVIVDGGKGQLSQAVAVLRKYDLLHVVPVVGLAKRSEEIFVPGKPESILLPRDSQGLFLLQRIRDEAHRFAITHHRTLRGKAMTRTALDDVPGVGPARRKGLLAFCEGDLDRLRQADVDVLAGLPGMTRKVAQAVQDHLGSGSTSRS